MNLYHRIANWLKVHIFEWLESHWVTPDFQGWLLGGLAIFFFAAATNTMAGWLYVISGVSFALLAIAAWLPLASLRELRVERRHIEPVSVGDRLTIEIEIENPSDRAKTLLQVQDVLPYVLGEAPKQAIEEILPHTVHKFVYYQPAVRRGIYRWYEVHLKTATPLGLFWGRRSREAKAIAFVYPKILPLSHCPLIDEIGKDRSPQLKSDRQVQMATEGITRTLRPYRYGDPTRLIHWRSSARYGEFRVRELEIATGGQEIIISLDSARNWRPDDFESAVIAAASLYFYASRSQLNVKLWTAQTGLVQGHRVVLETLAATGEGEDAIASSPPALPLVWLTQNPVTINTLPPGSRWVLWPSTSAVADEKINLARRDRPGLEIQPDKPLELQLQSSLVGNG